MFNNDIKLKSYENSSNITFVVIDSTADGYIMECTETFEKSTLEFIKDLDLEDKFGEDKMTLTIRYNTDVLGDIDSIINKSEIRKKLLDGMETLIDLVDTTIFQSIENKIDSAILSEKILVDLIGSNISIFHFPFGYEFSLYEPYKYDSAIINFSSEEIVTGKGVINFDDINRQTKKCTLIDNFNWDIASLIKYAEGILDEFGFGNIPITDLKKNFVDVQYRLEYYAITDPGIPLSINHISEVKYKTEDKNIYTITNTKWRTLK